MHKDIFCCSDENLLLFLPMETNKLLMFDKVEKASNLHSQWILKVYFTP